MSVGAVSRRETGQAAVELALIMPLYVFLILGILQLSLAHQARLMVKYAAYKAARAGSLHNANVATMEKAALAALLPLVSKPGSGGVGAEWIKSTRDAGSYLEKWAWPEVRANRMLDVGIKYVQVTICGPLQGDFQSGDFIPGTREVDFDNPAIAASDDDWGKATRTKLRIQVLFNYRMPIPFANMIIHHARSNVAVPTVLMLGKSGKDPSTGTYQEMYGEPDYGGIAQRNKVYILPIRASYTMRMQSNIYVDKAPLPSGVSTNQDDNPCFFAYFYKKEK